MADRYDLVIVGMGSGGIAAARFAAMLGLKVAAIERGRIGGDCLWTGCVPSKALLASAKAAHHMRTADRYGITPVEPELELRDVWRRIHRVQAEIEAAEDNADYFEEIGVEIVSGPARFAGRNRVEAGGRPLETRYALLCTGSRPAVPPIPGLEEAGYLTSETLFELDRIPRSVVVLGGGPAGVELSQALRRLGLKVTLLQARERLLERDEPELVAALTRVLRAEGVDVVLGAAAERVVLGDGSKVVEGTVNGSKARWVGEAIIVAAGRVPNLDGLGLEEVGVRASARGVEVDKGLRTSARWIYAAGDVAGRYIFTHSAAYEATIAVRNMFFPGRSKMPELVPWCTFTDPELAHAGLTSAQAADRHRSASVRVHRVPLARSDRARADGTTEGAFILVTARGRLVGAHVLAPGAGELIHELALAVRDRRKLLDLAGLIHVYPTLATSVNLAVADAAYAQARRFGWLARLWT